MKVRACLVLIAAALIVGAAPVPSGPRAGSSTDGLSASASQDRDAPGPLHETNLVLGDNAPSAFMLESIDGETFEFPDAGRTRPILLLFFRGTW